MNPTFIYLETQQDAKKKNNEDICKIFRGGGLHDRRNAKSRTRKFLGDMTVIMRSLKNQSFYNPLFQVEKKHHDRYAVKVDISCSLPNRLLSIMGIETRRQTVINKRQVLSYADQWS